MEVHRFSKREREDGRSLRAFERLLCPFQKLTLLHVAVVDLGTTKRRKQKLAPACQAASNFLFDHHATAKALFGQLLRPQWAAVETQHNSVRPVKV